jgi:hypothetical protein
MMMMKHDGHSEYDDDEYNDYIDYDYDDSDDDDNQVMMLLPK